LSKFADPEKQAMEDFRRNVSAGLGLPTEMVFGDAKQVESTPPAFVERTKKQQKRFASRAKRGLAEVRALLDAHTKEGR
jgi:hypothetical protein